MKKVALHWKIIIGLFLGLVFGIISTINGLGDFTTNWIAPFGTIFINLLKFIAVPLVLSSLISGVASLSDTSKLSRIGSKTILIYIMTTSIAVMIGLISVNMIQPGDKLPENLKVKLQYEYNEAATKKTNNLEDIKDRGPLQPLVDMVPSNFFFSASNNRNMLQIVFISIFIGIGLVKIPKEKGKPLKDFFQSLSDIVIKLVDLIMIFAPLGVFALIAQTINKISGDNPEQIIELLGALTYYMIAVIVGLLAHALITYNGLIKLFTKIPLLKFYRGIAPAQLLAFSTSSSGATLPVTMDRCEEELDVSEEVSSFVLPLGATINMDGTALYQAVAAVFIAQSMNLTLGVEQQMIIVLTTVLASIGTAAVPGAGIIMLVIILESISVPSQGIALILGVDRILDMIRTSVNVTGDASVAVVVQSFENKFLKK